MGKTMGAPHRALRAGLRPARNMRRQERVGAARLGVPSVRRRAAPIFAAIMLPARGFGFDRGPAAAAPSKRRPQNRFAQSAAPSAVMGLEPECMPPPIGKAAQRGMGKRLASAPRKSPSASSNEKESKGL